MDFRVIALLTAISIFAVLWFIVLLKGPKTTVTRIYSFHIFNVILWTFGLAMYYHAVNPKEALFWTNVLYLGGSLIAASFLHFSFVFPFGETNLTALQQAILYTPNIILFYLFFFTPVMVKEVTFVTGVKGFSYGFGHILWDAQFDTTFALAFSRFIKMYRRYDGITKARLRYIIIGTLIALVLSGATNVIMPWFSKFGLMWTAPLSSITWAVCIVYAIVRHRLMDIEVVIKRTVVYSATSALVVGGFILVILPLEALCQWMFGYTGQKAGILVAGAAGFIFIPIRNRVQVIVDKFFYRARYDYRKELKEFTRSLITIRDPEELSGLIVNRISNAMKLSRCSLILREETNGGFKLKSLAGMEQGPLKEGRLTEDDFLIRLQKHWKRVMVKEDASLMKPQNAKRFTDEMTAIGADLTAPLFSKENLIGILGLGNKMSGHMFSDEDMDLLATLADEAAIAIENATLYKKILDVKNFTEDILANMTSGVVTVDLEGNITALNKAALRLTHLTSGWQGESVRILGEELSRPILRALLEGRRYSNFEINVLNEKKEPVPLGVSTSILNDFAGKKIGAIMVFNDLSERKQMENEMRRMDRLASLGTLAAGMAHEIKNPLSSIKTFTQLLPEKMDDVEFRTDFLAIASKEVDRIDYLINQLLGFARPSKPQFGHIDVAPVINDCLVIIDTHVRKKSISVVKEFKPDAPTAYADERQLKQVFINIMVNAIQAMEEGGTLTLEVKRSTPKMRHGAEAEFLEVLIKDTGKGIPEDQFDKLFNPFFTTKHDGTGLGLAITHRIIEDHKGFIEVASQVGKGTTFTVNLPLGETAEPQEDTDIRSKEKGYGFGLEKTA